MPAQELTIYHADPAPRGKSYSALISARKRNHGISYRVFEDMKREAHTLEHRAQRLIRVRHNLLAPRLFHGQVGVIVEDAGFWPLNYVRLSGVEFVCRVSRHGVQEGHLRLWFTEELSERGTEAVVAENAGNLEIIGGFACGALNRFASGQPFWPAMNLTAN